MDNESSQRENKPQIDLETLKKVIFKYSKLQSILMIFGAFGKEQKRERSQ